MVPRSFSVRLVSLEMSPITTEVCVIGHWTNLLANFSFRGCGQLEDCSACTRIRVYARHRYPGQWTMRTFRHGVEPAYSPTLPGIRTFCRRNSTCLAAVVAVSHLLNHAQQKLVPARIFAWLSVVTFIAITGIGLGRVVIHFTQKVSWFRCFGDVLTRMLQDIIIDTCANSVDGTRIVYVS